MVRIVIVPLTSQWPHRPMVRTPAFHAGNTGSIPVGVTKKESPNLSNPCSPITWVFEGVPTTPLLSHVSPAGKRALAILDLCLSEAVSHTFSRCSNTLTDFSKICTKGMFKSPISSISDRISVNVSSTFSLPSSKSILMPPTKVRYR